MGKSRRNASNGAATDVMNNMFTFGRDVPTSTDELHRETRTKGIWSGNTAEGAVKKEARAVKEKRRERPEAPMSYKEREMNYNEVRARIFGGKNEPEKQPRKQAPVRQEKTAEMELEGAGEDPDYECFIPPVPDRRTGVIPALAPTQQRALWVPDTPSPSHRHPRYTERERYSSKYQYEEEQHSPGRKGGRGGYKGGRGGKGRGGSKGQPSSNPNPSGNTRISPDEVAEYSRDSIKFQGYVRPSVGLLSNFD